MLNVSNRCERLVALPAAPVSGNANQTKDALPSRSGDSQEYAYRFVQNVGAATVYFSLDGDCSAGAYHGYIPVGVQLNVPSTSRVSIFCASAWTVSVLELKRK